MVVYVIGIQGQTKQIILLWGAPVIKIRIEFQKTDIMERSKTQNGDMCLKKEWQSKCQKEDGMWEGLEEGK